MRYASFPPVEMLWESVEPLSALRDRFGFDSEAVAHDWLALVLREGWSFELFAVSRMVLSGTNALAWMSTSHGLLVAKWTADRSSIGRRNQIGEVLRVIRRRGLPVSAPIPALNGTSQFVHEQMSVSVQYAFEGSILDCTSNVQVREAGKVLAELHEALGDRDSMPEADLLPASTLGVHESVAGWLAHAPPWLPSPGLRRLRRMLSDESPVRLPRQIVHGDYRSTNVLWSSSRISTVLDFDDMRVAHRVDEVARSCVLLGTGFREWHPVSQSVREEFVGGYQSAARLTDDEKRLLPLLTLQNALAAIPGADSSDWMDAAVCQSSQQWESL